MSNNRHILFFYNYFVLYYVFLIKVYLVKNIKFSKLVNKCFLYGVNDHILKAFMFVKLSLLASCKYFSFSESVTLTQCIDLPLVSSNKVMIVFVII